MMRTTNHDKSFYLVSICALLAAICLFDLPLAAHAQGFKFLEVKVVDPDGKPMADVAVDISLSGMAFPMPTDDKGMVSLNVPEGGRVQVGVKHDGFMAQGVSWNEGEAIPDTFTIPMKKGVPIGGVVHDEEGKPIEGVKIEGIMVFENSTQLPGKGKLQPYFNGEIATTDKEGRWRVNSAPEESLELQLQFTHPEYISDQGYGFRGGNWEELRSLEKIVVMQKGLGVAGTVVDEEGQPIAGAKVGLGSDFVNDDMKVVTDAEGKYRINNVQAGPNVLTVFSRDFAPDVRNITIVKDMKPEDFELKAGQPMTFHITDPDGKPVPGVGVAADTWRGTRGLMTLADRGSTDADGMWTWEHAPADAVQIDMFCQGHMSVRQQNFIARAEPHEITMPKAVKVSGKVVDAITRQPIETFSVVQGMKWNSTQQPVYWERYNIKAGQGGKYSAEFDEPRDGHLVRIEVEGYRPGVSRIISSNEEDVTIDFELVKGTGPTGVVKLPDGKPAVGTEVVMATVGNNPIQIYNGRNTQQEAASVTTDAEGKFVLPFSETNFRLVCLGDKGWGEIDGTPESDQLEIVLEPWAKVEGVVLRGQKPAPNEQINLSFSQGYDQSRPHVYWSYQAKTGAEGKFAFESVRSGALSVSRQIKYGESGGSWMSTSSHTKNLTVKPGETATVQIGGKGRAIKGRLTVPKGYTGTVSWNMGALQLYEQTSLQGPQGIFQAMGRAIAQATSPAPTQPQPLIRRNYGSALDGEGRFEIFDVEPGSYQLSLTLYEVRDNQRNWNPQATLQQAVTVPEGPEEETVDLGDFEMKMTQPTPPPAATGATGATGTLQIFATPVAVPAQ